MRPLLTLAALCLLISFANAQHMQVRQAGVGQSRSYAFPFETIHEGNGNRYVTGVYQSRLTLGPYTLNGGIWVVYLAKYDALGNVLWLRGLKTQSNILRPHIARDNGGNVYVGQGFQGTAVLIPNDTLERNDEDRGLIVKFAPDGTLLWHKSFECQSAVLDLVASDKIYVLGYSKNRLVYETDTLGSWPGFNTTFCLVMDTAGHKTRWRTLHKNRVYPAFNKEKIALMPEGDICLNGAFMDSVHIDGLPQISGYQNGTYVARLDSNLQGKWITALRGNISLEDFDTRREGIYLTGYFNSVLGIAGDTTNAGTNIRPFVARLNKDGRADWAVSGNSGAFYAVRVNDQDQLIAGGQGSATASFGRVHLQGQGANAAIFFVFDTAGQAQTGYAFDTPGGNSTIYEIANGTGICVLGTFSDTMRLGTVRVVPSPSCLDLFWADFDLTTAATSTHPLGILSPNPAHPGQTLHLSEAGNTLHLTDIQGRSVATLTEREAGQYVLPGDIVPGYYLLTSERGKRYRFCVAPR